MSPIRGALDKILAGHQPFPAVIVDRTWNLVSANEAAMSILTDGVAPELLAPPANALRVSLHPDGLAPRIGNLPEYSAHLLTRLHRQMVMSGDDDLAALHEELRRYPGVHDPNSIAVEPASLLFVPLELRLPDATEVRFFSTLATFGTAESFYPADEATAAALTRRSR
jgi:hypothetical protein